LVNQNYAMGGKGAHCLSPVGEVELAGRSSNFMLTDSISIGDYDNMVIQKLVK
jgi:hypothetical protein